MRAVESLEIWFKWKSREESCLMTLKSDAKFEEKLTVCSKNDMRNLVNFNASNGKSGKLHFDVLLLSRKKLCGPFLWMGFNCLKARATSKRQFNFYHLVPRNSWYSFYQPRKDESLNWPWSHPVVLNTRTLGIQGLNH